MRYADSSKQRKYTNKEYTWIHSNRVGLTKGAWTNRFTERIGGQSISILRIWDLTGPEVKSRIKRDQIARITREKI